MNSAVRNQRGRSDTATGDTLIEEPRTTYDNGFLGLWLPRDISAILTINHEGRSATAPISTGEQDLTCLTTMQLA
ncbi:CueP family metal-binding protein [Dietzia psychralcaliphila]|uniref:CueP family metal-binding protein n=1 Tax=Dietzia psychralcaliphila TaxID=139021 RepID=UPI0027E07957|nr:CueP family metal-binding protein [Dietzia psychralcaliphila]